MSAREVPKKLEAPKNAEGKVYLDAYPQAGSVDKTSPLAEPRAEALPFRACPATIHRTDRAKAHGTNKER
jgi:hypothetical protein